MANDKPVAPKKEKKPHKISDETRTHIFQAAQGPASIAGAAATYGSALPFYLLGKRIQHGDNTKYLTDFADEIIQRDQLPVKRVRTNLREFNAYYDPMAEEVNTGLHGYPVMSHELGHASNFKAMGRKLGTGYAFSRGLLSVAGSMPGVYMSTSEDPDVRKYGPAVAAGVPSIVTAEEGLASAKGLLNVLRMRGAHEAIKGLPQQLTALGTYAGGYTVAPLIAGLLAKKYTERAQKDKKFHTTLRRAVESGHTFMPVGQAALGQAALGQGIM